MSLQWLIGEFFSVPVQCRFNALNKFTFFASRWFPHFQWIIWDLFHLNHIHQWFSFFLILTQEHAYWFLERGEERKRERKRNIDAREKYWLVASHMHPDRKLNPQHRHVPWPGTEPTTFQIMGRCSNQLSHTGQGHQWFSTSVLQEFLKHAISDYSVRGTDLFSLRWSN